MTQRYVQPGWFTNNVLNRAMALLARLGVSVYGSRLLAVRGRLSGEWRTTPVNLLAFNGARYLVAPRGVTQWVRNVRAGGAVELRLGAHSRPVRLEEIPDDQKVPILRAYLRRWRFEIGAFFPGVSPDATDEQLRAIAPGYPVFRVLPAVPAPRPSD